MAVSVQSTRKSIIGLCSVESVLILMISSHLALHLRPAGDTHTNCINHDVHTCLVATFSSKESLMSGTIYRLQLILLLCQLLRVH